MVFIDREKAYDNRPQTITLNYLKAKGISLRYIKAIQDMYNGITTNSHSPVRVIAPTMAKVSLYPFVFAMILDELSKSIRECFLVVCFLLTIL